MARPYTDSMLELEKDGLEFLSRNTELLCDQIKATCNQKVRSAKKWADAGDLQTVNCKLADILRDLGVYPQA